MWLRLPNGRQELIHNEDHIKRHLGEGAFEIPDPREIDALDIASNEEGTQRPKRGRKPKLETHLSIEATQESDLLDDNADESTETLE